MQFMRGAYISSAAAIQMKSTRQVNHCVTWKVIRTGISYSLQAFMVGLPLQSGQTQGVAHQMFRNNF